MSSADASLRLELHLFKSELLIQISGNHQVWKLNDWRIPIFLAALDQSRSKIGGFPLSANVGDGTAVGHAVHPIELELFAQYFNSPPLPGQIANCLETASPLGYGVPTVVLEWSAM